MLLPDWEALTEDGGLSVLMVMVAGEDQADDKPVESTAFALT